MAEVRREDLSLEGFLAWENRQPERFERVGGVVRLRDGDTLAHDLVTVNAMAALAGRLRGTAWSPHGSQLKIVSPRGDVM